LKVDGMKKYNFKNHCALCGEKKDKYTIVFSMTHNYVLCLSCYPRYDCLDYNGKKWLEKEYMSGESGDLRYGK